MRVESPPWYERMGETGRPPGEFAGWVPAEERLPAPNVFVLVAGREGVEIARHYPGNFWLGACWLDDSGNGSGCRVEGVTHWAPLPAPPAEVQSVD